MVSHCCNLHCLIFISLLAVWNAFSENWYSMPIFLLGGLAFLLISDILNTNPFLIIYIAIMFSLFMSCHLTSWVLHFNVFKFISPFPSWCVLYESYLRTTSLTCNHRALILYFPIYIYFFHSFIYIYWVTTTVRQYADCQKYKYELNQKYKYELNPSLH